MGEVLESKRPLSDWEVHALRQAIENAHRMAERLYPEFPKDRTITEKQAQSLDRVLYQPCNAISRKQKLFEKAMDDCFCKTA